MNLSKNVYVSQQHFISATNEWRYDYVIDGVITLERGLVIHRVVVRMGNPE